VELLVEHGCQLDSVDAENRTALRAAAWSGHEEIVKILLQHGANVNLTDHEVRSYSPKLPITKLIVVTVIRVGQL